MPPKAKAKAKAKPKAKPKPRVMRPGPARRRDDGAGLILDGENRDVRDLPAGLAALAGVGGMPPAANMQAGEQGAMLGAMAGIGVRPPAAVGPPAALLQAGDPGAMHGGNAGVWPGVGAVAPPPNVWHESPVNALATQQSLLAAGSFLEADLMRQSPGVHTIVVQIVSEQPSDGSGKLLQVRILGHSTPTAGMLGSTFMLEGARECSICGAGGIGPMATGVLHSDRWRALSAESLVEDWLPAWLVKQGKGGTERKRREKTDEVVSKLGQSGSLRELLAARADAKMGKKRKKKGKSDGESDDSSFHEALLEGNGKTGIEQIQRLAERTPGALLADALLTMQKGLAGTSGRAQVDPSFKTYLAQVWSPRYPPSTSGARNTKELGILADALDGILDGSLSEVGDLLCQRFKAIMQSILDGHSWHMADELEVGGAPELRLSQQAGGIKRQKQRKEQKQ
eukprot:5081544-Amphidinium_carterae.1